MMTPEEETRAKVEALEDQVMLLWAVLHRMPRLEGFHDSLHVAQVLAPGYDMIEPLRFEDDEKHE